MSLFLSHLIKLTKYQAYLVMNALRVNKVVRTYTANEIKARMNALNKQTDKDTYFEYIWTLVRVKQIRAP